ncbi:hypothetical protein ACSDR0_38900 [Streptosporangium sp. G11]|uniref:hypothetical protein n=1 Tax=Streptosporangium sp. G11 TaxID=3436926 RepID=UPI003EC09D0F
MGNFWSGLIAGLLGAVVGGFFTAWGALMQTRGMLKATHMEIEASLQRESQMRRDDYRDRAISETLYAVTLCDTLINEIIENHRHPDSESSGCSSEAIAELLLEPARKVKHLYWMHESIINPSQFRTPLDDLNSVLDAVCFDRSAKDLNKYLQKISPEFRVRQCAYGAVLDWFGTRYSSEASEFLEKQLHKRPEPPS